MSDAPSTAPRDPIGDAYASPVTATVRPATVRPLGITVTGVLCTVLGLLGVFNALMTCVGLFFGQMFNGGLIQDPDSPSASVQARIHEINSSMMLPNLVLTLTSFVVSICFLSGGVGLLMSKPWSATFLRRIFLAAIIFEIVRGVFYVYSQTKMVPVMSEAFSAQASQGGPDLSQMTSTFMMMGLVVWGVWAVVKIGLMIWGRIYLASQTAKDYLTRQAAS